MIWLIKENTNKKCFKPLKLITLFSTNYLFYIVMFISHWSFSYVLLYSRHAGTLFKKKIIKKWMKESINEWITRQKKQ